MWTPLLLFAWQGIIELVSPLGKPLTITPDEGKIEEARRLYQAGPPTADALLTFARTFDEQWRFLDSIPLYTEGLERFPNDFRFPRFRGHRYISTRKFDLAAKDLERAHRLAPSSFDVAYHLGLAYYLRGDYAKAARTYGTCLALAGQAVKRNPLPAGIRGCTELDTDQNARVAMAEWHYRSLRQAGRLTDAAALLATITEGMKVTTNESYYKTLLFYKGLLKEDAILPPPGASTGNSFSTIGYGVGLHHLLAGNRVRACHLFRRITSERAWNAFGYIAAEGELVRGVCP